MDYDLTLATLRKLEETAAALKKMAEDASRPRPHVEPASRTEALRQAYCRGTVDTYEAMRKHLGLHIAMLEVQQGQTLN